MGSPAACLAVRRAAHRPRPWPHGSFRQPRAPTPAARSGSRQASAALRASSRPTARCSRYGMIAFASSLDQAGPLARSARRLRACCSSAMSGFDERDATSAEQAAPDFAASTVAARPDVIRRSRPLAGLRIGLARRVLSCRTRERRRRAPYAPRWRNFEAPGRDARRREPAAHRAVDSGVLHHRAMAEASRRTSSRFDGVRLRPPRREVRRPARHVQEEPFAEGFGRRGQATHHDRHVRAVAWLLRRLLPAGAEAAPHDRRRLPAPASSSAT